jgi:hypothetical protein
MGSSPVVFIGSWLIDNASFDLKMGSSFVALIASFRLGTLVYACPYLVGSIFLNSEMSTTRTKQEIKSHNFEELLF